MEMPGQGLRGTLFRERKLTLSGKGRDPRNRGGQPISCYLVS
jgi:hypothetical protein